MKIPGYYRVRYFIEGSLCCVGEPVLLNAHYVLAVVRCPDKITCGLPYEIYYEIQYRNFNDKYDNKKPDDGAWIGLYELGVRNPEDCITSEPLGKNCKGTITISKLPKYPGEYELKLYLKNYNNKLITKSPIFHAGIPLPTVNKYQKTLQRCLRIYITCSYQYNEYIIRDMNEEREFIKNELLTLARKECETRKVSIMYKKYI